MKFDECLTITEFELAYLYLYLDLTGKILCFMMKCSPSLFIYHRKSKPAHRACKVQYINFLQPYGRGRGCVHETADKAGRD